MQITMQVGDWLVIDATMDNVGAVARQSGGQDDVAAVTHQIRRAGWDQVATHEPEDGGWPARDSTTQVELSRDQWLFVAHRLRHWARMQAVGDGSDAFDLPGSLIADRISSALD